MSRHVLLLLLLPLVAMACTRKSELPPEEAAKQAAQESAFASYEHLLSGHYEKFLEGRAGMDSIPAGYREQLIASYRQFMAQQEEAHQGIKSVVVNNVRIDSTLQLIQVFLILNYADSTHEEVVVPMVEYNGRWLMK